MVCVLHGWGQILDNVSRNSGVVRLWKQEIFKIFHYWPQGKVMFSEACVVCQSFCPRGGANPAPPMQTRGGVCHPPCRPTDPPPPETDPHPWKWHLVAATAAVGTHPTEMHSCFSLWWCLEILQILILQVHMQRDYMHFYRSDFIVISRIWYILHIFNCLIILYLFYIIRIPTFRVWRRTWNHTGNSLYL